MNTIMTMIRCTTKKKVEQEKNGKDQNEHE
jgi:hypothetical protein